MVLSNLNSRPSVKNGTCAKCQPHTKFFADLEALAAGEDMSMNHGGEAVNETCANCQPRTHFFADFKADEDMSLSHGGEVVGDASPVASRGMRTRQFKSHSGIFRHLPDKIPKHVFEGGSLSTCAPRPSLDSLEISDAASTMRSIETLVFGPSSPGSDAMSCPSNRASGDWLSGSLADESASGSDDGSCASSIEQEHKPRALQDFIAQESEILDNIKASEQKIENLKTDFYERLERAERDLNSQREKLSSLRASCAMKQGGGPEFWGITIQQLVDFKEEIKDDLREYCTHHKLDRTTMTHVCTRDNCPHNHGCAKHRARDKKEDLTLLESLTPDMHTVVNVFVKPRTQSGRGLNGLALTLNENCPKKVQKFISHSWNGRFEDFVKALESNMLHDTVVFICSFALPQNLDIECILKGDLMKTPFARVHDISDEVWLVVDQSIDVLDRAWVIFETYLSLRRMKPMRIALAESSQRRASLDAIKKRAETINVAEATASSESDLKAIRKAIRGEEKNINFEVQRKIFQVVHQRHHI